MAKPAKIALFVEGSYGIPLRGSQTPLEKLWKEDIIQGLGLRAISRVIPISKKHLTAMDPAKPRMSGASEGLDQLLVRELKRDPFDAALVAWDLFPIWNPTAAECRWQETLDFYRLLMASKALAEPWLAQASQRHHDLSRRKRPNERLSVPRLVTGSILAVCMDPVFEGVLVQDEVAVREALNISGQRLSAWPTDWKNLKSPRPDQDILQPALMSARKLRPPPGILTRIRGDMRTAKDAWGSYLLGFLLSREPYRTQVLSHPTMVRLREALAP